MTNHEKRLRAVVAESESKTGSTVDPKALEAACRFLATLTPRAQAAAWFSVTGDAELEIAWVATLDWTVTISVSRHGIDLACLFGVDEINGTAPIDGTANPVVAGAIEMVLDRGARGPEPDEGDGEPGHLELVDRDGKPFS